MNDVSRCNIKCENNKYLSCKRYKDDAEKYQDYKIEFNKICDESNNYKYFIQNDAQIKATKETEEKVEN